MQMMGNLWDEENKDKRLNTLEKEVQSLSDHADELTKRIEALEEKILTKRAMKELREEKERTENTTL